jgi:hypothetical protein
MGVDVVRLSAGGAEAGLRDPGASGGAHSHGSALEPKCLVTLLNIMIGSEPTSIGDMTAFGASST